MMKLEVKTLKILHNTQKSCCFGKKFGMIVSNTSLIDWWTVASIRSS